MVKIMIKNSLISFIVLTYNQEDTVLETLDSIKYQIQKYGDGKEFQLIIADDASRDKTTQYCDRWIQAHKDLFTQVDKLYSESNQGVASNYTNAIRAIKGQAFRIIAGDDLFPANDIFLQFDRLEDYDIILHLPIKFSDNGIMFKYNQYTFGLNQSLYNVHELYKAVLLKNPISIGAIIKKELYTENVLKYIEKFDVIEDWPQWQAIFSQNDNLKIIFVAEPSILYRQSETSIMGGSKGNEIVQQRFKNDIDLIRCEAMKGHHSLYMRAVLKGMSNEKYIKLAKLIDYNSWKVFIRRIIKKKKITKLFEEFIKVNMDVNKNHMREIKINAYEFRNGN